MLLGSTRFWKVSTLIAEKPRSRFLLKCFKLKFKSIFHRMTEQFEDINKELKNPGDNTLASLKLVGISWINT